MNSFFSETESALILGRYTDLTCVAVGGGIEVIRARALKGFILSVQSHTFYNLRARKVACTEIFGRPDRQSVK